jgi:hypothetical protein
MKISILPLFPETGHFQNCLNHFFTTAGHITLNADKTNFMTFWINNKTCVYLNIMIKQLNLLAYKVMVTSNAQHIAYIIHKLCSLNFLWGHSHHLKTENLNPLTSFPFHHIVWSNAVGKLKTLKVTLYPKIIRIMTVVKQKGTRWQIFRKSDFLPLANK